LFVDYLVLDKSTSTISCFDYHVLIFHVFVVFITRFVRVLPNLFVYLVLTIVLLIVCLFVYVFTKDQQFQV